MERFVRRFEQPDSLKLHSLGCRSFHGELDVGLKTKRTRIATLTPALLLLCLSTTAIAAFNLVFLREQRKASSTAAAVPVVPTEKQSFADRCAGKGVLVCQGFDLPEFFVPAKWPNSGLYPGGCRKCDFRDTTVKASGASSYRMEIPGNGGQRPAGNWAQRFGPAFGPGSTFYVQYAFRADENWLVNWDALLESSPKLSIFHNWAGGTCATEEITTNNLSGSGAPAMYGECGNTSFVTQLDGVTPDPQTNTPYLIQQGFTDSGPTKGYACHNYDPKSGPPYTGNCFYFQANTWYTLYWKIHIGAWGKPNSSVEAYVGPTGGQLRKFINAINWTLNSNRPADDGFDALTLTQFMTNAKSVPHPSAYVWYDELIVSSEPIAPPTAPQ